MRYEDRITLHTPEALESWSGVERLGDGVCHLAALTRMTGTRAEMIGWWFGTYTRTPEADRTFKQRLRYRRY